MKQEIWVTTETNPFDPFTQMDRWINWDEEHLEGVCRALARYCYYSTINLSDDENDSMIDLAVNALLDKEWGKSIPLYQINKDGTYKVDKKGNLITKTFDVHYVPAIRGMTQHWGICDTDKK